MRLIDADALRENMQWCIDHGMYDKPYDYLAEIDDAPTIDAVDVVRCRDCKYWHSNTEFCDIWSYPNVARRTLNHEYCRRGERREDGET